ncbi:hypothetical protein [Brachybacterium phenoliresistens]|uniref:hypothetical protein n=1 Tax=Brachybacterium phenoliresistens TaxID=396014 RepID=UPI0031DF98D9
MIRALHFHDAAGTGARLVAEARDRGMGWDLLQQPAPALSAHAASPAEDPSSPGAVRGIAALRPAVLRQVELVSRPLRARVMGERLRRAAAPYDVLHVHGGHKAANARWARRPLAVHLHGSDIRLMQYAPSTADSVRRGVEAADLVVYATPDLPEHAQNIRHDVHYLPVPISSADLPAPPPDAEREGVLFVSRWEESKGGAAMLEIARILREKAPDIPLRGIDWGDGAAAAARLGVELIPRQEHAAFLRTVAGARVAIAQANAMIGTSELEALGLSLPLIGSFREDYYPGLRRLSATDPAAQAEAAIAAHRDAEGALREQGGAGYVAREHETGRVLERLVELYRTIV